MTPEYIDYLTSPLGLIKVTAQDIEQKVLITEIAFVEKKQSEINPHPITDKAVTLLKSYFADPNTDFVELFDHLAFNGTEFQCQVWRNLLTIASGETWSYQQLASVINNPKAVRAVGSANSKNTIAIVVPCHRVIGANGKLTGYAGGLDKKAWLLKHESLQQQLYP